MASRFRGYERGVIAGFAPREPLIGGHASDRCRAVVVLPARNEEQSLPATLDALAAQVALDGKPLPPDTFETVLLLNNCTDHSAAVAHAWVATHPHRTVHVAEREVPAPEAHVGTARAWLMDTAWHRLGGEHARGTVLSTDADTCVAPDWVAQNLRAVAEGADAVGGTIRLLPGEWAGMPRGARRAYIRDRLYQRAVAELEDWFDPQPCDPWPRHLEHFGASLACTAQMYARAGGMKPVCPLEDVVFVDALRRAEARLRHDPAVVVYTSARLNGRADVGLSGQLTIWQKQSERNAEQRVLACAALEHRFRSLAALRALCRDRAKVEAFPAVWHGRLLAAQARGAGVPQFLADVDCDRLIAETRQCAMESEITVALADLRARLRQLRAGEAPPA